MGRWRFFAYASSIFKHPSDNYPDSYLNFRKNGGCETLGKFEFRRKNTSKRQKAKDGSVTSFHKNKHRISRIWTRHSNMYTPERMVDKNEGWLHPESGGAQQGNSQPKNLTRSHDTTSIEYCQLKKSYLYRIVECRDLSRYPHQPPPSGTTFVAVNE